MPVLAVLLLLALLLPVALPGDAPERDRELLRLVPSLDHVVARHLLHDDDSAFREFSREIGSVASKEAVGRLYASVQSDSPQAYRRSFQALYPYISRVADVLATEHERPEYARLFAFRASLGDSGLAHLKLILDLQRLQQNGAMDLMEKIERYREFAAAFERIGDERELMTIEGALARDVMQKGLLLERMRLLRSALSRARRLGENMMVCQFLGELGVGYRILGELDLMLASYREGIARADRCRIPEQASRLRMFLARHYLNEGRLAVGANLLEEAQVASRRLGGSPLEIRTVMSAMQFYADLGCWDMVRRSSDRVPVLVRSLERGNYVGEARYYGLRARLWRGRWLAASGRAQEAADTLDALYNTMHSTEGRESLEPLVLERAATFLQAGRAREALSAAEIGMAFADSVHLQGLRRNLALIRARAALALREFDLASSALADAGRMLDVEKGAARPASYIQDGLAARIAMEAGREDVARRLLERGLAALRDSFTTYDRGAQSDLMIREADDLRLVAHRLFERSADRGLAFEVYWRSLASRLGGSGAAARQRDAVHARGVPALPARSLHLVYAVMPEGLVRWTSLPTGVRRDVLEFTPEDLSQQVARVIGLASTDPGNADATMPDELRRAGARLGRLLLPPEVHSGAYERVEISAEGALGLLPFELLGVGSRDTYEPLLARHDVCYVRPVRDRPRRTADGASLILADDPRTGPRARLRESLVPLPAVETEISTARARLPGMHVVRSGSTSKQALLRAWSRAPIVYVAAHLVRDPDAPLLNHFPIAFGAMPERLEDGYLDIRDVRDTDLSACRLVVLSSCASGEPYVVGDRSGPSMADAFLDAGAAAVIHTRWRVRDESAAVTAPLLAEAWLKGARPGSAGWRAARLGLLRGPRGLRHPFEWAAWSVTRAFPVRARGVPGPVLTAAQDP